MERSLLPLPIRKWQEYKKTVNSGKACCTEMCYLELDKERKGVGVERVGGWLACCWLLLFWGDIPSLSYIHSISFQVEWTPSKLDEAAKDQDHPSAPVNLPQHSHPSSSQSIRYLQQTEDVNCLRVISEKAKEQVVGYHSCTIANTKNSNKTSVSSLCMAGWRNMSPLISIHNPKSSSVFSLKKWLKK